MNYYFHRVIYELLIINIEELNILFKFLKSAIVLAWTLLRS